ncbi:MAG: EVE domain-containing protein [Planctomycetes bacterium]|nr:EVE domain-containing protein [Planctomycetota bacterium]
MAAKKTKPSFWLFKSEPDVFSIDDLKRDRRTSWEGVRNYQARNLLRDDMKVGDGVLFYHSNAKPLAVVGVAKIVRAGYPDHFAWEPGHKYFDPKCDPDDPAWYMVDVSFVAAFDEPVTRDAMQSEPSLADMMVLRRGARLSVQPVTPDEWRTVVGMGLGARAKGVLAKF